MSKRLLQFVVCVGVLCISRSVFAQANPVEVSGCDLARNPKAFDGTLVRVRGTLNVYFEDFSLGFENCDTHQGIWLAFGGDVPGIVASTVNDNSRTPGSDIQVDGVSYGIKKDDSFRKLYALIVPRHGNKPDYRVTATLTGMFFAGNENRTANGTVYFSGYGHVWCCSLFVITEVADVESVPPANLNLRGVLIGLDGKPMEGFTVFDDVIGGSPAQRQETVTNKQGEFEVSNSGQQLRFEDPNYRPLALTVKPGGAPLRVRLQSAKRSDWLIPACGEVDSSNRIGFSVLFILPNTMESSPFSFSDEGIESIFIYPRGGDQTSPDAIISSSSEKPTDETSSLDSKRFEERWIKDSAGKVIGIDARGRDKHSAYWRVATFLDHDTFGYSPKPGQPPNVLDQMIESACIAKR